MKRFTSFGEIETLCEAMIKDYHRAKRYDGVICVDIEGFVREYLGLPVIYETFAEPDPGRVGFCSDGRRPLRIRKDGGIRQVTYPAGTIVIEKRLRAAAEGGADRRSSEPRWTPSRPFCTPCSSSGER